MDSVLSQTFTDFECILVDDCSTDNCPTLCDKYAKKDVRVSVIHNEANKNLAISRKIGLDKSCGKYIQFIDSDDWIEPDMLESMYNNAVGGDFDIVWCDYWRDNIGRSFYRNQDVCGLDKIDIIKLICFAKNEGFVGGYTWNKLFARDVLKRVRFSAANMWEDMVIVIQAIYYARKIGYIHKAFNHYCHNPESLCRAKGRKLVSWKERFVNFSVIIEFLLEKYGIDELEPDLYDRVNRMKQQCMRDKDLVSGEWMKMIPESNKHILRKSYDAARVDRICMWFASKGFILPYKLFDIIKPHYYSKE
ncbi:glycosyl transferase [Synergistales bacterium]|nr:glycosyl transferase [Synergistales bacterium]